MLGKDSKAITISPRRPDTSPQTGKDVPGPGTYDSSKMTLLLRTAARPKIGTA
jgi:hypothetical protein